MSGKVIPMLGRTGAKPDARMRFCLARRDMNMAFREWLEEQPSPIAVQEEIDDSLAVLRGLRDLFMAVRK
jgi:hypothetical protein